jgi:hypothetical protein
MSDTVMKVWMVRVSIEVEMPVVAPSASTAEEVAKEFLAKELENDCHETYFSATELRTMPQALHGALPWGSDGDRSDWTVKRWLDATVSKTEAGG